LQFLLIFLKNFAVFKKIRRFGIFGDKKRPESYDSGHFGTLTVKI